MSDEPKDGPKKTNSKSARRQDARIRRNNVELRAAARGYERPTPNVFLAEKPIVIGPEDSKVVARLLVPNRERKNFEGRYPPREVLQQLRNALSVHAFVTYYSMIAIYDNKVDAPERKAQELIEGASGKKWRQLRTHVHENLGELTPFCDTADVKRWASRKIREMQADRRMTRHRTDHAAIEAELAAVKLLSLALQRAKDIVAEFEKVEQLQVDAEKLHIIADLRVPDEKEAEAHERIESALQEEAHDRIQRVFNSPGWDCPVSDLIQIAIFADINPATLWPQRSKLFAALFEMARFVGRVNAGRAATLQADLHGLVGDILRSKPVYDFKVGQVAASDLRHHLMQHFGAEPFLAMIAQADAYNRSIGVTALTRQLILVDRLGPGPTLGARASGFLGLFSRKCHEFLRLNPSYNE